MKYPKTGDKIKFLKPIRGMYVNDMQLVDYYRNTHHNIYEIAGGIYVGKSKDIHNHLTIKHKDTIFDIPLFLTDYNGIRDINETKKALNDTTMNYLFEQFGLMMNKCKAFEKKFKEIDKKLESAKISYEDK